MSTDVILQTLLAMKEDMGTIKADVADMRGDIAELVSDHAHLKKKVQGQETAKRTKHAFWGAVAAIAGAAGGFFSGWFHG